MGISKDDSRERVNVALTRQSLTRNWEDSGGARVGFGGEGFSAVELPWCFFPCVLSWNELGAGRELSHGAERRHPMRSDPACHLWLEMDTVARLPLRIPNPKGGFKCNT